MSLPDGFLDELRNRLPLSQVVGRKVMWDSRKSNQAKGDMWAPCPFHQEKTASFHVDDRKGFFYCFGCHAKGDAIGFVKDTENVGFMEAVEILAAEAGLTMPARDPRAQQKADRRTQLAEVMEQAVQYFRLQLKTGGAGAARDYLDRRGLSPEAQERWEIGFAHDAWQGLWDYLKSKNIPDDLILGAGLAKPGKTGNRPYDTFRGRIMFPIRDARGRAIAFGGRAMDPNDNAKYLNSPETDLFDKSRSLYNHGPAREAAGKGQPLIVAEGYMDVIALSEAGFTAAVAPLGTAVTEHQLHMLWRIVSEPIIALDGDTAGLRAAFRVIDTALPLIEAGKSLRFVLMPDGMDPDDLIRAKGPKAVAALLETAMPMVRLLWQRETEGRVFDSPERKAALDKALRDRIATIRDPSIRGHYEQEIKDLRWQLFRAARAGSPQKGRSKGRGWQAPPAAPRASTRSSLLAAADAAAQDRVRVEVILATLVLAPEQLESVEPDVERLDCPDHDHALLRDLILRHAHDGAEALRDAIARAGATDALDTLMAAPHVTISPVLRRPDDPDLARMTLTQELAKWQARRGLDAEIAEAEEDFQAAADEFLTRRLRDAAETSARAERSQSEDTTEYEVGANGARINRGERNALDDLMGRISYSKKRK